MTSSARDSLAGLVIAFDIDNTLVDSTGRAYRGTQEAFWREVEIPGRPEERAQRYEQFRSLGDALERVGLPNPVHDRAHPEALAAFLLLEEEAFTFNPLAQLPRWERANMSEVLRRVDAALRFIEGASSSAAALAEETRLRRRLAGDSCVERFVCCVRELASDPRMAAWSGRYQEIEASQPEEDRRVVLHRLAERGADCVVISEGRDAIQRGKLARSGLAAFFEGRILLSDRAARPPGRGELDEFLEPLLDRAGRDKSDLHSEELSLLWHFRWILERWSRKSPGFYARCLHALQAGGCSAEAALDAVSFAAPEAWTARPMRFVMVGDREDKDAAPLTALLGERVGLRLLLTCGKYGGRRNHSTKSVQREMADWQDLSDTLLSALDPAGIRPIDQPPAWIENALVDAALLERARHSPISVVRRLSEVLSAQVRRG